MRCEITRRVVYACLVEAYEELTSPKPYYLDLWFALPMTSNDFAEPEAAEREVCVWAAGTCQHAADGPLPPPSLCAMAPDA